jgi:ubiquinol-cytochrome c reductase cytochrome c subunit
VRAALAVALAGLAAVGAGGHQFSSSAATPATPDPHLVAQGRRLYLDGCSSCHGGDARGIRDRGPSLRGAGEVAADFYLRTGRMPLENPSDEPVRRSQTFYSNAQIRALVAYVGSFGGPRIPSVAPVQGDLGRGKELFTEHCAGCHQVMGRGGIVPKAVVPALTHSEPIDVAEAVEVGPYVMPKFTTLTREDVNDLARYVEQAKHPDNRGGLGLGNIGPVPEGAVTFLVGMAALLLGIRIIGERTTE